MDAYLAIASRRDERRYRPDPLPDDVVERILDAGRLSGSASNRQPWTFVIPTAAARLEQHRRDGLRARQHPRRGARRRDRRQGQGAGALRRRARGAEHAARRVERRRLVVPERPRGRRAAPFGARARGRRGGRDRALVRASREAARRRRAERRRNGARARTASRSPSSSGDSIESAASTSGVRRSRRSSSATAAPGFTGRPGATRRRVEAPRRWRPRSRRPCVTRPRGPACDAAELTGVGIGAPGSIDASTGSVLQVANVEGLDRPFPLAPAVAAELGAPATLGNDVSVAVEAERRFGAGRGLRSFLGVFWGTGVGGGLVVDGRLLTGRGSAGEIGHMCAKPGGLRCNCGLRGCVEAYAGRGALEERARKEALERKTMLFDLMRKRGRDRLTSGIWLRALDAGDEVAGDLLGEAVEALGVGIGSAVTLLDVEAVILGGGLGERLGPPLARSHRASGPRAHVLPRSRPSTGSPSWATSAAPSARASSSGEGGARHRRGRGPGRRSSSASRPTASPSSARTSPAPTSALDVRDPVAWDAGPRALEAAGEPWGLVNCAARTIVRDLYDIEPDEWDDVLATNLRGPFLGIRAIGAAAARARAAAASSTSRRTPRSRGAGWWARTTRHRRRLVISLTRRAAAKLAPSGVTVNAVVPGTIDGETVRELAGDQLDALAAEAALGRLAGRGRSPRSSRGSCRTRRRTSPARCSSPTAARASEVGGAARAAPITPRTSDTASSNASATPTLQERLEVGERRDPLAHLPQRAPPPPPAGLRESRTAPRRRRRAGPPSSASRLVRRRPARRSRERRALPPGSRAGRRPSSDARRWPHAASRSPRGRFEARHVEVRDRDAVVVADALLEPERHRETRRGPSRSRRAPRTPRRGCRASTPIPWRSSVPSSLSSAARRAELPRPALPGRRCTRRARPEPARSPSARRAARAWDSASVHSSRDRAKSPAANAITPASPSVRARRAGSTPADSWTASSRRRRASST